MTLGVMKLNMIYDIVITSLPGMDKDKQTEIRQVSFSIANPLTLYDAVAGHFIDGTSG